MKSYQRLGMILIGALCASCVAAPFVWSALQGLRSLSPQLSGALDFPFDRVMRRVVLVAAVLFFVGARKKLEIVSLASMGLRRAPGWGTLLVRGWLLGICSLALMLVLMIPSGSRVVICSFSGPGELVAALLMAFLSGVVVAFIEEPIFRGFVLQSLLRSMRAVAAVVVMSLFFAVLHFFNASDMPSPRGFDPLIGFKAIAYFFQPLRHPAAVMPGFIGLFLVGVVLAYAYLRTGSLYPGIGIHAGWVLGIKAESLFLDRAKNVAPWFFGDGRVVTGIFGWLMLCLMVVAVRYSFPRRRSNAG